MRRTLLIVTLALIAAAPAAPAAAAAGAKVRLASCVPALNQAERAATFTSDMRTIPGASRLQVKFVLRARTAEEPGWESVAAPGFGTWYSSAPGIGRYVYSKTVENLLAPADYRTTVHFRWLSSSGRTLLRARRTSKVCRQPDMRPDLAVERVAAAPDGYEVTLANTGRTAAVSFTVTIEIDGQVHPFGYVEELGPKEKLRLQGQAPACRPGTDVIVRVDADGAVAETDEAGNALSQPCPQPGRG